MEGKEVILEGCVGDVQKAKKDGKNRLQYKQRKNMGMSKKNRPEKR